MSASSCHQNYTDLHGKFAASLAVQDITGESIVLSESHLFLTLAQSLYYTNDAAKIIEHIDGRYYFRYFNKSAHDFFLRQGFDTETWLHKSPQDCLPPQMSLEMLESYAQVVATQQEIQSDIIVKKDSSQNLKFHRRLIPINIDEGNVRLILSLMDDITAVTAMNQVHWQYSSLLENITEMLIFADSAFTVYYINPAARAIFDVVGYPDTAFLLQDFFADPTFPVQTVLPHVAHADTWSGRCMMKTVPGKSLSVDLKFIVQRDNNGHIDNYIVLGEPVSEQDTEIDSLHRSEQLITFVRKFSTKSALIELDNQGNIQGWGDDAVKMFGYSVFEVLGRPLSLLEPNVIKSPQRSLSKITEKAFGNTDDNADIATDTLFRLALETEKIEFDAPGITYYGNILLTRNTLAPRYNRQGEHIGYIVWIEDISQIQRLQFDLFRRNRETALFVEQSSDIIFRFSLQKICEYVNRIADNVLSVSRSTLIGKHIDEIIPSFPAFEGIHNLIDKAILSGLEMHHKGNMMFQSHYQFALRVIPEFDEQGRMESFLIVASNIALELVAAETILKTYSETKLWHEFKERFRKTLSHELRTPLAGIKMAADILGRYTDNLKQEDIRFHAKDIHVAADEVNAIIDDILLRIKQESQALTVIAEQTELVALCRQEIDAARKHYQYPIEFSASLQNISIQLDAYLFQVIMTSLLENAILYSDERRVPVRVWLGILEQSACISVHNVGIGIAKENLHNIFQPFFRGKNVEHISGIGMGLYIANQSVTLLHGRIEVQSEPGSETVVSVFFPLEKTPENLKRMR